MCGRFTLRASSSEIAKFFDLLRDLVEWDGPRFNIAPTQSVLTIRELDLTRQPALLKWGLIPSWAKEGSLAAKCINARAEDLVSNRVFRTPFRRSRCLVVADGFYEWQTLAPRQKVPNRFSLRDGGLFAFAGLMDRSHLPSGEVLESCAIITTEPNSVVAPVHNRMPVILHPIDYDQWLDPLNQDVAALQSLLLPFPANEMRSELVSNVINNARVDVDPSVPETPKPPPRTERRLFDFDEP